MKSWKPFVGNKMKKKTTSKRPSNNFDNAFAKAIFKSDLMAQMEMQKRRSNSSTSKKHSDINHTPPIEGEEGEAEAR